MDSHEVGTEETIVVWIGIVRTRYDTTGLVIHVTTSDTWYKKICNYVATCIEQNYVLMCAHICPPQLTPHPTCKHFYPFGLNPGVHSYQ